MHFWCTENRAKWVIDNVEAYQGFEVMALTLDQWRSLWLPVRKRGRHLGWFQLVWPKGDRLRRFL
jgi:hypothetical protein